jgi:hypothetical protein
MLLSVITYNWYKYSQKRNFNFLAHALGQSLYLVYYTIFCVYLYQLLPLYVTQHQMLFASTIFRNVATLWNVIHTHTKLNAAFGYSQWFSKTGYFALIVLHIILAGGGYVTPFVSIYDTIYPFIFYWKSLTIVWYFIG